MGGRSGGATTSAAQVATLHLPFQTLGSAHASVYGPEMLAVQNHDWCAWVTGASESGGAPTGGARAGRHMPPLHIAYAGGCQTLEKWAFPCFKKTEQ